MSVIQGPPPEGHKQTGEKAGFSRRQILKGGLIGAGLLTIGSLGYRIAALPDKSPAVEGGVLTRMEMATVEALALGFFPPGNPFGIDGREADVAGYVDRYISLLSPVDQKIVRSLFWVYDQGSIAQGYLRPARFLTPAEVTSYLRSWEFSRLGFRRDLALSLRTVVGMAFFAHPTARQAIGITEPCHSGGPSLVSPGALS